MEIGDRIRELRNGRGLTLRQLAEKSSLSISFLSDCENNKSNPSIGTCQVIAEVLGVPVSRLLGEMPEDSVRRAGNAFIVTWRSTEAERLAELLRTFDDWKTLDKQELLAYLTAKETARGQEKTAKNSR